MKGVVQMNDESNSRLRKNEKRRKNSKFITYLGSFAVFLVLLLIGVWIFGGGDDDNKASEKTDAETARESFLVVEDEEEEETSNSEDEANNENEDNSEDAVEDETDSSDNDENEEDVVVQETEGSDDNVKEAYMGNWAASGTVQTGPHTTVYEGGSQDRIEMKEAASIATGIPTENLIEWWVENGGDQKVIATVSDREETETFRVFLSWIDDEGWQATKIETLIENDGKKKLNAR